MVMPVLKSLLDTMITSLFYCFNIVMRAEFLEGLQRDQIIFFHEIIIGVMPVAMTDPRLEAHEGSLFPGGRPHGESNELRKGKHNPLVFFVQKFHFFRFDARNDERVNGEQPVIKLQFFQVVIRTGGDVEVQVPLLSTLGEENVSACAKWMV